MANLDDIIDQPLRLRIMAALNALPSGAGLEFARLKSLTGAHDPRSISDIANDIAKSEANS